MVKITCPAVRFAASRNDKVKGRTRLLIISTVARNGARISGAPSGISFARGDVIGVEAFLMINRPIHVGMEIVIVISKWAVVENT